MRHPRLWIAGLSLFALFFTVSCSDNFSTGLKTTCSNGKLDRGETGIDCGGSCEPCSVGQGCNFPGDCKAGLTCGGEAPTTSASTLVKVKGACLPDHCLDKSKNQGETDEDCGGTCPALCAISKSCVDDGDCKTSSCVDALCVAPTCDDGKKNQSESGIDCGDPNRLCPLCSAGSECNVDANCESGICNNGTCANPSCSDSKKNASETGVDCGGTECPRCESGEHCVDSPDCVSRVCGDSVCQAPSCNDRTTNGSETDEDCGGTCSTKCAVGKTCKGDGDCVNGACSNALCVDPSCNNSRVDGKETDKDCGGGGCSPCVEGAACLENSDCKSGRCVDKVCAAATCTDRVKNGLETAVDCGGDCEARCENNEACEANRDCKSNKCNVRVCQAATCSDEVQNGLETDTDCGGQVCRSDGKKCENGRGCSEDADCANGVCNSAKGLCEAPSCHDTRKNQDETGTDCGGSCGATCPTNTPCKSADDCADGVCEKNVCSPPSCGLDPTVPKDNVKNGDESDVDCGGGKCPACADNKLCNNNADCDSKVCGTGSPRRCLPPTCSDGVQNGLEWDLDCGDHSVSATADAACRCDAGQKCKVASDCDLTKAPGSTCPTSGEAPNMCTPPGCSDDKQNGAETDFDCGGGFCPACDVGQHCLENSDCVPIVSGKCGSNSTCVAATCGDSVKNGVETDTDCGGTENATFPTRCGRCPTDKACSNGTDCQSGVCSNNKCAAPSCTDDVKNGTETDLNCGGATCAAQGKLCAVGQLCESNRDCASDWCDSDKRCKARSCTDNITNGAESDTDCGTICPNQCAVGKQCNVDADCASGACSECTRTCVLPASSCLYMGTGCSQCDLGGACSTDFDCKSYNCDTGIKKCTTADNCVGNLFATSGICTMNDPNDTQFCKAYLRCFFINNCNPYLDPIIDSRHCYTHPDGICGDNRIWGGNNVFAMAKTVWGNAGTGTCPQQ